ncbi:hypothetical protein EGW08_002385, partial [Elysia chlorotica]
PEWKWHSGRTKASQAISQPQPQPQPPPEKRARRPRYRRETSRQRVHTPLLTGQQHSAPGRAILHGQGNPAQGRRWRGWSGRVSQHAHGERLLRRRPERPHPVHLAGTVAHAAERGVAHRRQDQTRPPVQRVETCSLCSGSRVPLSLPFHNDDQFTGHSAAAVNMRAGFLSGIL